MRIIISGGGTGGHIFPALALAKAIKKDNPNSEILFVGAKGKMEMERVPKAGFKIEGLWISGFQRKLTLRNLSFPFKLISSLWKARRILKRFKPEVVVGVGGYASGPTLEMAVRLGIPTLIQEQNSYPGITNRLLGGKVDRICVAFEGLERFFPAEKLVLTGNPVRDDLRQIDLQEGKSAAMDFYGLDPSKKTILIVGGSLGAKSLNEALQNNTSLLKSREDVQVLWQAGKIYEEVCKQSDTAKLQQVTLLAFLERMDLAYAAADVVVGRAGALTISELCLLGKAAILVPSPNVAEDHQTKNCKALVERNAAVLVKDKDADSVLKVAMELLDTKGRVEELSKNIYALAIPNATQHIVKEIKSLVNRE